jgi:hypothetical protein
MCTVRIARPTDRLAEIAAMYRSGLNLTELGRFHGHDGYDGVMLGRPDCQWHLEFTTHETVPALGRPSPEHLLVFYLPDRLEWESACTRMEAAGFRRVTAENPYWNRLGRTYADPDGYHVVLQHASWPP